MPRDFSDRSFAFRLKSIAFTVAPLAIAASCGVRSNLASADDAGLDGGGRGREDVGSLAVCDVDNGAWFVAAPASVVPDTVRKCEVLCGCASRYGSVVDCLWNDLSAANASLSDGDDDAGAGDASMPAVGVGQRLLKCRLLHPGGRRPAGLAAAVHRAPDAIGLYFARLAHMEAASIEAFTTLARDLTQHGAPHELVADAHQARRDEINHARAIRRFAERRGASVTAPRAARLKTRSLEAIAIENAVEGCVLETYAALVALWQARHADDNDLRVAMATIADDEARHAALSWRVGEWAAPQLGADARRRVRGQMLAAIGELKGDVAESVDESLVRHVGLPTPQEALALISSLERDLWYTDGNGNAGSN